jgi:NADPH2:quinone reductase
MQAIRFEATGGPEVLRIADVPTPVPGPGQARVRIEAAGLNFIDVYHRSGLYPVPLPATLGLEGAGRVEAVGPDVHGLVVGDRVAWANAPGSYAEEVVAPAERLVKVPAGVDGRTAAAVMLQGMTAHYLVETVYPLGAGNACLVHAAAGGVGLLLAQMAKRKRARVLATVSTEEKAALAREAGADEVILYTRQDFAAEVKRLTGGRGVDVVYDSVGLATFEKGLECLALRGMMVLYGQSSGVVPPLSPSVLAQGSFFLTRPTLFHYTADRASLEARAGDVLGQVASGALRVRIGRTFPLAEAADAHRALEGRRTTGKVLLVPKESRAES